MWQSLQFRPLCPPLSGKALVWVKVAPCQVLVPVWHCMQSVLKPLAAWLGLVVDWKSLIWQLTQSVDRPWKFPPTWQSLQFSPPCPPLSANELGWSKVAPCQVLVPVWHCMQSVLKPLAAWLGLLVDW